MKNIIIIGLLLASVSTFAQKDYYTKRGVVVKGYDVVAYFNNKAVEGNSKIATTYDNVKFYFSTERNLAKFKKNPTKYIPQYGGFCAYAMGVKGNKVSIDPETFEIRDGKLYLFYNRGKNNTLEFWRNEGAKALQKQADINWKKIISKD